MPREVSGRVRLEIDLQERNTLVGDGTKTAVLAHQMVVDKVISNGLGDGQMDRVHSQALSVTTTPTDVDLAGSLSSAIGAGTTTFVDVSMIAIRNTSTSGNLVVGGDANFLPFLGGATHTLIIPPGGVFYWEAPPGVTCTAGTGDILQIAASSGTVTGVLIVGGRSA